MSKEKLNAYFYSNIATIFWSSFLLLGGGIFVAYFAHIEYMPEFDLKSSITITAAAAVTALIITAVLLVVMVLPGAFWGNTWGAGSNLKSYWTDSEGSSTFLGLLIWFALPLAAFYGAAVAAFFIGWFALVIIFAVFVGYFIFIAITPKLGLWTSGKEVFALFGTSVVASAIIFIPLWLVVNLSLYEDAPLKIAPWVAGILSGCFIIFVNVLAATTPKNLNPFYWYLGLSVITLFVVFASFEKFHRIPVRVMELYKFGNIATTDLVLEKNACEALRALEIDLIDKKFEICVAKNILIMSRLGREAYLRHGSEDNGIKFTIASSDIISWAVRVERDDRKGVSNKAMQPTPESGAADG